MDHFEFMLKVAESSPVAGFFLLLFGALALSIFLFWPFTKTRAILRFPFFLVCIYFFLNQAMIVMPRAFPGAFEFFLGHSVTAPVTHIHAKTAMQVQEPWILSWRSDLTMFLNYVTVVGFLWGLANLVWRRESTMEVILNVVPILVGGRLLAWWILIHFAFPVP